MIWLAKGTKWAFRMTLSGTNTGGWGDEAPTGKPRIVKETYFAWFENGKIVEYVNLARSADERLPPARGIKSSER